MKHPRLIAAALVAATTCSVAFPGCASTGIAVREAFGYAKREQLVGRVTDARDEQVQAKRQFESALAEFLAVTGVGGSPSTRELEDRYARLKDSYETSESRARDVRDRIVDVENVAGALFKEWNAELGQYSDASMRSASEKQLGETRDQYDKLLGAMKAASAKMDPVLARFKDQVLFLKHNLNARAISSLRGTAVQVQDDVTVLVAQMQAAIDEADRFIEQMQIP